MRAYSLLLIKTCHRRGIHAMGGMAAQIPVKNNPQANEAALAKVRASWNLQQSALLSHQIPRRIHGNSPNREPAEPHVRNPGPGSPRFRF